MPKIGMQSCIFVPLLMTVNIMILFLNFSAAAITGIKSSAKKSKEAKQNAVTELKRFCLYLKRKSFDRNECRAALKIAAKSVIATIDKLVTYKENLVYTFEGTLNGEMDRYFAELKQSEGRKKILKG